MNTLYKYILITLIALPLLVKAQCDDFPQPFTGNTGSNMTVFLTADAVSSLPITSDSPYVVGLSPSGLIVGSSPFAPGDLIGGQQTIAIWADDSATPELDGALPGEEINFQLVDGNYLYALSFITVFGSSVSFTANAQAPVATVSNTLLCSNAPTVCDLPVKYEGNTGANMTVMLTSTALNSLPITQPNAYLVAYTTNNLLVGSSDVYGITQGSLAIWGDDSFTSEINGALDGESILVQLVDGNVVYGLEIDITFILNSISALTTPINYEVFCESDAVPIYGCVDQNACNYNSDANTNDGSCEFPDLYFDCDGECLNDSDGDGVCDELEIVGCQEPLADNYNSSATDSDFCQYLGCIDLIACNYDPVSNTDDGLCEYAVDY